MWSQKSPYIFCRLDYWLILETLQDLIKNVNIIAVINTDQSAIVLHLQEIKETKKRAGILENKHIVFVRWKVYLTSEYIFGGMEKWRVRILRYKGCLELD